VTATRVVIEHEWPDAPTTRAVIAVDALTTHEARGWVALGPCSDPLRDPIRTDQEQAAHDAAEAERIAALLAPPSPDDAPAPSRPRK
jgi:hypothetical protein